MKKSFFKNPPFNENLKNSQEWLMHSEMLLFLKNKNIHNLKKIVCLVRRGNERMSDSKSAEYFYNQFKARIFLLNYIGKISFFDIYQLFKQSIVYFFYSIIRYYFKTRDLIIIRNRI
jgi:hypothetical protein